MAAQTVLSNRLSLDWDYFGLAHGIDF
jgi:hypothetical protein